MTPLLTDLAFTAFAVLMVLFVVGMVLFFIYDSVATLLKGDI